MTKQRGKNRRSKNIKEPMTLFQWIASIITGLFVQEEKTKVDNVVEIALDNNITKDNKRALLIGSNFSETKFPLRGCINDLKNINAYLRERGFTDITIVSDDEPLKKTTRPTIIKELTDFLAKSKDEETLYIHFSGHGIQRYTMDRDEEDGMNELICTYEENKTMSFISDNQMNQIIQTNLVKGATLYIVFDCCHSGTMLDLRYTYNDTLQDWFASDIVKDTRTDCGHIIMLSGCCDEQTSADALMPCDTNGVNYQGALTYSLLNAMNKDKEIEIGRIYNKTLQYLYENNYEQYPLLSTNKPFAVTCDFL